MSTFVLNNLNRRCHRAGSSTTSYAGAMTSLIFCVLASSLMINVLTATSALAASILNVEIVSDISLNVVPLAGGVFVTSSTTTSNISVKTDHYTGYTLGIMASDSNNALINTADSSKTIPSLTAPVSEANYRALSEFNNTWGYRPSKYHSLDNADYLPIPTDTVNSDILDQTSVANPTEANNYNIALGTRLDSSVAPGSYSNNLVFTVVVNPTPYTITYYKNTTSDVTNMPENISSASTYAETVTISASVPARDSYHFKGWCTTQVEDNETCTGIQYNAGDTYPIDQTSSNNISFYAVWREGPPPLSPSDCPANSICYAPNANNIEGSMSSLGSLPATAIGGKQSANINSEVELISANYKRNEYGFAGWSTSYDAVPGTDTIYGPNETISTNPNETGGVDISVNGLILYPVWVASAGAIQNWNGCNAMAVGDVTALKDSRDNNVYAVAKLVDGKCWIMENLRIAGKDVANNDIILSSSNTHNPSLPLTNSWWYSTSNNSDPKPTSNKLSDSVDPATRAWCQVSSANCNDQSMLYTGNSTYFASTPSAQNDSNYSYGNYYNWYSATAGHGVYSKASGNTAGDICPAGWHIPTGGSATAEFGALDVALGGTGASQSTATASKRWRKYPNNFVYSGYVNNASTYSRGTGGRYWSSSANNNTSSYYFGINSGDIIPGTSGSNRYFGRTIRCLSNS